MTWQHITYLISIIIAAAVMGFIAWYSRKQRASVAGAGVYMWIAIIVSLLSIFQGLSMIGISVEWALFWFNMRVVCFALISLLWLVFVLHYFGETALISKARIAILFVIPVITQIMLWTNDMHGWWVIHDVGFHRAGPFFIPDTTARIPGRWYIVHNLYTYAMMLAGLIILFVLSMRLQSQYRGQAIALGVGTLVMAIGALFPAFNLVPGMELNPLPQSFALGSLIIAWGLYRHRFLGTSPLFDKERQIPRMIVMLFVFLAGGILTIGGFYYQIHKSDFKTSIEQQLSSTVELKVSDIARWREERLADAGVLFGNAAFTALVRRSFADSPDGVAQEQIRNWLKKMQTNYHYDHIVLLDVQGNIRLSVPQSVEPVCVILKQQAAKIMRAGRIVFLDLHREAPGKTIHLSVLVPIIENGRPLGIVALFIDPAVYLYPLINRWSTPSRTAETLLVRRDGNSVLYLNELKFRKDTALNLRVPLTEISRPAVMAALGREGIVEGIDYRGEKVIAVIHAIPDSPWIMVARINSSEVYAPLRDWFWLMIVLLCALIAGLGSLVWLIWRRQTDRVFREKIEAAERLLESEKNYHQLFENAGDAIFIADAETEVILDANSMAEKLLDMPKHQIVGMNRAALHPRTGEYDGQFRSHANAVNIKDAESIAVNRAGRLIPVSISAALIELEGRKVVLGIFRNITERKQVEEEILRNNKELMDKNNRLKEITQTLEQSRLSLLSILEDEKLARISLLESETKYRSILENMEESYFEVDLTGNFTFFNDSMCRLLEYPRDELMGMNNRQYNTEEDAKKIYHVFNTVYKTGQSTRGFDLELISKDGRKMIVETSISLMKNTSDQPVGFSGIVQDVTVRKQAEEELRKHRYHLGELVILRTAEAEKKNAELIAEIGKRRETEKELNIAKELADAANLAKSDFLANMSHELRTPLNSVIGFSEVLQNQLFGQLNEKQLQHVQYILGSGKHLLEVINDILDLSKGEAGKMELNPQIFAIKAMLIGVNLLFKEKALNHRIQTSVEIAADVPAQINADERKVKQIMFNLLSNALKFTPDGGSVKVTARLDKDSNGVALVVEDTGIGIKDDDLQKIFQPFFQIESTYTKTKTGTGLGLAITKKLVELHGGDIKMESEWGKGSKVTVMIPIGT